MKRRLFIAGAVGSALAIAVSRNIGAVTDPSARKGDVMPLDKTKDEWKKLLETQHYEV